MLCLVDALGYGYTQGMKTAISIPEDLFGRTDEFARKNGKSRSQVVREALSEYLLRRDSGEVTEAIDEALAEIDQDRDVWAIEAGRQALERSEW